MWINPTAPWFSVFGIYANENNDHVYWFVNNNIKLKRWDAA